MKASSRSAQPSRKEFLALARTHTLVPVCRTLMADLETPVSAFLRAAWPERECFLLESVEGGEQVGRYTFIGLTPFKRIVARGREIAITEGRKTTDIEGDIFAVLREALSGHKPARLPGLPPFTAGAVGFFAYDAVRQIERLPARAKDELGIPDACLLFFDEVLAFDHVRKEIWLVVTADVSRGNAAAAYDRAVKRLDKLERRLRNLPLPERSLKTRTHGKAQGQAPHREEGFHGRSRAHQGIHRAPATYFRPCSRSASMSSRASTASRSIAPAHRQSQPVHVLPALRPGRTAGRRKPDGQIRPKGQKAIANGLSWPARRPSFWSACIKARSSTGPSPARGRRGATEAEDHALAEEMMHDEKERAEHVMLVDLGRNDVGRVSRFGSVKVDKLMFVERYSHVMHIVSSIEGKLRPELTAVDALRACFPAGTLSGAPKVRAMEIIEELEPARRGTYGGAVLYADFSGNLDSCIAIRSMLSIGGKGSVQAGAGIVADSVPELEHQESINKAQAVIRAIERAREL